jgi:hypothetical protein
MKTSQRNEKHSTGNNIIKENTNESLFKTNLNDSYFKGGKFRNNKTDHEDKMNVNDISRINNLNNSINNQSLIDLAQPKKITTKKSKKVYNLSTKYFRKTWAFGKL